MFAHEHDNFTKQPQIQGVIRSVTNFLIPDNSHKTKNGTLGPMQIHHDKAREIVLDKFLK